MPVSFSLPQHPCSCKGPTMVHPQPPPILFAPVLPYRRMGSQAGWNPFPRMFVPSACNKPKKIIRIKDPQTGHDVTEEILSSASVSQVRSETFFEPLSAPRMPLMPQMPVMMPCASNCMCRHAMQPSPPLFYNCRQCRSDFEKEMFWKNNHGPMETNGPMSKLTCTCSLCSHAPNGTIKPESRRQYCYSRKFLLKLRSHPAAQVKPKAIPEYLLPGFSDAIGDYDHEFGNGDFYWR